MFRRALFTSASFLISGSKCASGWGAEGTPMPKHLTARPPLDATEERHVRKLAHSVPARAVWPVHAKMIALSWDGQRTRQMAKELGCHPVTVRHRLQAFNARRLDGLGMLAGSGRRPRLTQHVRSTILALVKLPTGKPTYELTGELAAPNPDAEPEWTLDTLTAGACRDGRKRRGRHGREGIAAAGAGIIWVTRAGSRPSRHAARRQRRSQLLWPRPAPRQA